MSTLTRIALLSVLALTHFDFDDDVVESGLQRPDDSAIDVASRARHGSLLRPRANFLPELVQSTDAL